MIEASPILEPAVATMLMHMRDRLAAVHEITSTTSLLTEFPVDDEPELAAALNNIGNTHHAIMLAVEDMIADVDQMFSPSPALRSLLGKMPATPPSSRLQRVLRALGFNRAAPLLRS